MQKKKGLARTRPKCRLSLKLASKAPVAVVFRRGPSNWVQLIRWDLRNDSVEAGQWFKGRIYPEFSELSEDGELLLYSARKGGWQLRDRNGIGNTWTAVSRPPFFTALALWNNGCWDGGGTFNGARGVRLDLAYPQSPPGFAKPRLRVESCGLGEPPLSLRIALRAGWQPLDVPIEQLRDYHWQLHTRLGKEIGGGAVRVTHYSWLEKHRRQHQRFTLSNIHGEHDLGEIDLLDFDHRGRLIRGEEGKLLVCDEPTAAVLQWRQIADFSGSTPTPLPPRDWAKEWPAP
ncbi:hypothetical protein DBO85_11685 [Pseudomonas mangrovi]|uniref:Uncharacterized protein n=2 Tax=Pseudomonas mangrovi TaxID=2161748 RepID=A0A2T5P8E6_9PSED|nr:hypothetical protein DBO85_11685 [Pseudomonas mangrovi]